MEYPNYSSGKNGSKEDMREAEYERFIPDTSSRKHVLVEQKNNTSLGTSSTYKNKDLRKHSYLTDLALYLKTLLSDKENS